MLHLTYADPDGGKRIFSAQLVGDVFRDAQGRVVGRAAAKGSRRKVRRGAKRAKLTIDETRIIKPEAVPKDARFKGIRILSSRTLL